MDLCETCKGQVIMYCQIFPDHNPAGCFVECPECGQKGFGNGPDVFMVNQELIPLMKAVLKR